MGIELHSPGGRIYLVKLRRTMQEGKNVLSTWYIKVSFKDCAVYHRYNLQWKQYPFLISWFLFCLYISLLNKRYNPGFKKKKKCILHVGFVSWSLSQPNFRDLWTLISAEKSEDLHLFWRSFPIHTSTNNKKDVAWKFYLNKNSKLPTTWNQNTIHLIITEKVLSTLTEDKVTGECSQMPVYFAYFW